MARLLTGKEIRMHADGAYKSRAHDSLLFKLGVDSKVNDRLYKSKPMSKHQKSRVSSAHLNLLQALIIQRVHFRD